MTATARSSTSPASSPSLHAEGTPRLALRKEEAARSLGISDESFDRYVRPNVRVVRLGTLRLYPVAELRRFLEDEAAHVLDGLDDRGAA